MSGNNKENPLNKLKQFFRKEKTAGTNFRDRPDFILNAELERELRPETPVAQRCKALRELSDEVLTRPLEDASLKKLWDLTKDLIVKNKPAEQRQIALVFYHNLIQGQFARLALMRAHFFSVIQKHDVPEDIGHLLKMLCALTDNGKVIRNFEEEIGMFMLHWIPSIVEAKLTEPFMDILMNVIKFNAAHLDKDVICGIVQQVCHMSCRIDDRTTVLRCLQVIDTIICYSILPNETLPLCLEALCRTVNKEAYCSSSWKVMKNLLCTNHGYASLLTMCAFLNDPALHSDETLLRGAVFHINMGLWGPAAPVVTHLWCPPSTVLLSFLQALQGQHIIVTFEVILSLKLLITKNGKDLQVPTWDVVCDLLFAIADNIWYYKRNGLERDHVVQEHFHETINIIERMLQDGSITANPDLVYSIIERVADDRPETSVFNLINYLTRKITVTRPQWIQALYTFVERFYRMTNLSIRAKTIHCLIKIMEVNRAAYEEEILERVVIPIFNTVHQEPDVVIRTEVAKMLVAFTQHCETKRCLELLDIIEKLMMRPFECHDSTVLHTEADMLDIIATVEGLIKTFIVKLYKQPSSHAIRVFHMLVSHLEHHYQRPKVFEVSNVRHSIFNWMLRARANSTLHIGYPDEASGDVVRFSHYLGIDGPYQMQRLPPEMLETISAVSLTTISIRRGCKMIVRCLETDRNWIVVNLVLRELPNILQNKALIQGNDIDNLAKTLFSMYKDKNVHELYSITNRPVLSDFQGYVLAALAGCVTYYQFLEPSTQKGIVGLFKKGLYSRVPSVCVHALTIMILEVPENLVYQLPDILLEMSKMSTTVNVAVPVLEFLSTLSRLPNHLFASFQQLHNMYLFAIAQQYTNPYKYDHYTVSLAYHVIAGWFLKCKMHVRVNLVKYLTAGLTTNVRQPLQENKSMASTAAAAANEDSSNRQRSSSLTEQGSRHRERPVLQSQPPRPKSELKTHDDALFTFHMELAETCIDFLARHTYSPYSTLPKRLPSANFLLAGGQSQTWLVGHTLITITTSGCSSQPVRNGLCDRCLLVCKTPLPNKSMDNGSLITSPEPLSARTNITNTDSDSQQKSANESESTDVTTSSTSSSAAPTPYPTQDPNANKFFRQTSNEGRFSNSSGSLEALSRRGSNPDTPESNSECGKGPPIGVTLIQAQSQERGGSGIENNDKTRQVCACFCTGWAEICVRRPTGNVSWVMRVQNQTSFDAAFGNEFPLHDLVSMYMPQLGGGVFGSEFPVTTTSNRISEALQKRKVSMVQQQVSGSQDQLAKTTTMSQDDDKESVPGRPKAATSSGPINIPKQPQKHKECVVDTYCDVEVPDDEDGVPFDDADARSRNPVRRVNSSPEMSSNWRSPHMGQKSGGGGGVGSTTGIGCVTNQSADGCDLDHTNISNISAVGNSGAGDKKKCFCKDMRVSCEAIPEEIAGSTPPSQTDSLKESDGRTEMEKNAISQSQLASAAEASSTHQTLPRKQHSADDAVPTIAAATAPTAITLTLPEAQKITSKPPAAIPLSPRLIAKNAANKIAASATNNFQSAVGGGHIAVDLNGDMPRGRSKTISVSAREHYGRDIRSANQTTNSRPSIERQPTPSTTRNGISPSFVFLQLYHTGQLQVTERPLLVGMANTKAISLFDLIPPFETHKIGVLYVGPGQSNNETDILKNRFGSLRYAEFLRRLGVLVALKDAKENNLFMTMETDGSDGNFTYIWQDDIVQVTFHVATLMPNKEQDPYCNEKKKHIGNDYVTIVYNESGEDYNLNTIKGQFNYACIIVQPLEFNSNRVFVQAKSDIASYVCHSEPKIVSDNSAPLLARQLALHANLASLVSRSLKTKTQTPYASNWLERLRKIKNLRNKLLNEKRSTAKPENTSGGNTSSNNVGVGGSSNDISSPRRSHQLDDFTDYTCTRPNI